MNFRIAVGVLLSLIFTVPWAGCGKVPRPDGLPPLYPATITLTQEGAPLAGAMVSLFPENDPEFRWSVAAISDETGTARLKTHAQFPGAPEGVYKVVVQKSENSAPTDSRNPDIEEPKGAPQSVTIYHLVEIPYTSVETTPLSMTVGKGKNAQKFDLGKAVREMGETIDF